MTPAPLIELRYISYTFTGEQDPLRNGISACTVLKPYNPKLSVGGKKLMGLATILAMVSQLLLLDEPTSFQGALISPRSLDPLYLEVLPRLHFQNRRR